MIESLGGVQREQKMLKGHLPREVSTVPLAATMLRHSLGGGMHAGPT